MFTGVSPGEHGIFQFWETQGSYIPSTVTSDACTREMLWCILARCGFRVGVVNVPMTHPPRAPEGGYMISWPLVPTIHYSDPRSVVSDLARLGYHYHSDLVTMYRGQEDYLSSARQFVEGRTSSLCYLQKIRPVDAMIVVYTELDRVSHHFWGDFDAPSEAVVETYETMDRAIGRLIKELTDENTLVVVASDHGFGRCRYDLNLHRLLEEVGLLGTQFVACGRGEAEVPDDVRKGASWSLSSTLYRRGINWPTTKVFMPAPGCFGLNLNRSEVYPNGTIRGDAEAAFVTREVADLLNGLRDPDGELVFEVVPRTEMYTGRALGLAPDLLLRPYRWHVMPQPSLDEETWVEPRQQAVHYPDGVLFVAGMGVREPIEPDSRIEQVMPTILALLGVPLPDDLDVAPLECGLGPVSYEPSRQMRTAGRQLTAEQERLLEQRLAALGYL